jgi:hypothetical protein
MTDREFFISRRPEEFKMFQEVLRAIPADKLGYKPHDRSPSAAQIITAGKGVWLRGLDLNQRPLGYEPNELPDCSTPQIHTKCRV